MKKSLAEFLNSSPSFNQLKKFIANCKDFQEDFNVEELALILKNNMSITIVQNEYGIFEFYTTCIAKHSLSFWERGCIVWNIV